MMPIYSAYGINIRSDIRLPALPEIDGSAFELDIRRGRIPEGSGGVNKFRNWEAGPGRYLGHFHDVGRVLVTGGDTMIYDCVPDIDETQIVSILLGTGLGAALMQRGILPLHACCVLTPKGAVLVMGQSGAGKSTTLGGLLELDFPMMADDVTGLAISSAGIPMAIPAFPSIRLWQDSLQQLGHRPDGLPRVRHDLKKYYLPSDNFHNQTEPVRAIIHITASNRPDLAIEAIEAAHRVEAMSRFIFRKNFIDGLGLRRPAFEKVACTVNQISMLRVTRPYCDVAPRYIAKQIIARLDMMETEASIEKIAHS